MLQKWHVEHKCLCYLEVYFKKEFDLFGIFHRMVYKNVSRVFMVTALHGAQILHLRPPAALRLVHCSALCNLNLPPENVLSVGIIWITTCNLYSQILLAISRDTSEQRSNHNTAFPLCRNFFTLWNSFRVDQWRRLSGFCSTIHHCFLMFHVASLVSNNARCTLHWLLPSSCSFWFVLSSDSYFTRPQSKI
jgi:hypothetical protein